MLKFIHILSAIVAVGSNVTYGVWNVRAQGDPSHMGFALKGIKFLDDRIANPAHGLLARRNEMIGPILGLVVVVILVMMVFKPTL